MDRIEEIRAREQAATPGEWIQSGMLVFNGNADVVANTWKRFANTQNSNADFIAHARADIPYLLSEIEALKAENARLSRERDAIMIDLKSHISAYNGTACKLCVHNHKECKECCFEWRGIEPAESEESK